MVGKLFGAILSSVVLAGLALASAPWCRSGAARQVAGGLFWAVLGQEGEDRWLLEDVDQALDVLPCTPLIVFV